ncbi:type IV toxin-antitoxin system AbiEi family antitoxin domain-containing protein [Rhodococcus artemisiae]|uniref:Type IV toxin-antitoxin system AbiEi family antitoxin n=1 Tax=Rhodococcus artemisiae TaxID=714159 RepID=A0ABU7LCS6_9NOCA|nr:type IV toxin-antitoxin system AbiEi family antitoxin [Rhodococcus artemisiae]MEE2059346.1 type IV toxin-antitoxin system AbiEi family antitoxin [Rhodococcus artemisiae]
MTGWTDSEYGASGRADADELLRRLAVTQAGFFTARQAVGHGITTEQFSARIEAGQWLRVECELFRLCDSPPTKFDEFAQWCAWYEGTAVVSHQSAADLHGMGHLQPRFLHLSTVDQRTVPSNRLALHHRELAAADCELVGCFRVTTPARTAVDLAAGGVSQEVLDELVGDAIALGRADADELHAAVAGQPTAVADRIELALLSAS